MICASKPNLRPSYTVPELAAMLGISVRAVRRILASHGVQTIGSGRRNRRVALCELREKLWPMLDSWQLAELARKAAGSSDV